MKQVVSNLFNPGNYSKNIDLILLILRVSAGVLMLTHGVGKLESLIGNAPIQFPDPIGIGAKASLTLAVFSEVFCSLLLIIGFATRLATIPLLITMFVATFIVHINDPFGRQELPLLYATMYLVLLIAGAGKISMDNWVFNKINQKKSL